MTMRIVVIAGALLGLLSVGIGAAGDHILGNNLTDQARHTFDTALRYHQLYAIVIFCMGLYGTGAHVPTLYKASCMAFILGLFIFSGSLYAGLFMPLGYAAYTTPAGGFLLMAGWILAALVFVKKV